MQHLIAWLLRRYTPFRVVAWDGGKISGIGSPGVGNIAFDLGAGQRSGVAQMRAQQFETAMREPKPWPLDRRSQAR